MFIAINNTYEKAWNAWTKHENYIWSVISDQCHSLHRMSWNLPLLLLYLKSICSICHGKIVKVPVSRIDVIWNKGRHVYVSQCTDWHVTAVKQATVVVHGVSTLAHILSPIYQIPQNIDAVLDIYTEGNILKALTHQRHGNDPRTRVGNSSTPITKRDWNSSFLSNEEHTHFQGWHGLNAAIEYPLE